VPPTPPDDGPSPYPRISYVIGRLDRALRRRLEQAVRQHGVTVSGYMVLSILADRAGQSNAQLARRSFMSPQAMNEVLRRLDDDGLVVRTVDPDHARVQLTNLTARGRKVLRACDRAADVIEAEMFEGIPDARLAQLTKTLITAVHRLEQGDT
jgi:DNA-binding MarR family transcriptional regulator